MPATNHSSVIVDIKDIVNSPENIPPSAPAVKASHARKLTAGQIVIGLSSMAICTLGIGAIYARHNDSLRGGRLHATAAQLSDQMVAMIRDKKNADTSFETGLGHTCNTAQSIPDVENDVACWQDEVAHELSNGNARIVLDTSTVPSQYVITISWTDPRTGTASYVQRIPVTSVAAK